MKIEEGQVLTIDRGKYHIYVQEVDQEADCVLLKPMFRGENAGFFLPLSVIQDLVNEGKIKNHYFN